MKTTANIKVGANWAAYCGSNWLLGCLLSSLLCAMPVRAAESPLSQIALAASGRGVNYQPSGVGVNPATRRTYVACRGEDRLLVMDERNEIVARVPAPGAPRGVAVDPLANMIYVTASEQNAVLLFNGDGNALLRQIPVGKAPTSIAVNVVTKRVYVLNSGDDTVSVLEGNRVQSTIKIGEGAQDLAVDAGFNRVYVTCYGSGAVKVIDGASNAIVATTPTGQGASGVAVNLKTHRVYVVNGDSNTLSIIDGNSNALIASLPVGEFPQSVAVNSNSGHVYVGSAANHTVTIVDGSKGTILSILDIGSSPTALAVNPNAYRVYIASSIHNTISCLKDVPGQLPQGLAIPQTPSAPDPVPAVSNGTPAPIDALLTSILGLTMRKKFDQAHRMVADAQKQYGRSFQLAQIEAAVFTQEGKFDEAEKVLRPWLSANITVQPGTLVPTAPSAPSGYAPPTGNPGAPPRAGQPSLPIGSPLAIPVPETPPATITSPPAITSPTTITSPPAITSPPVNPEPGPERLPVLEGVPGGVVASIAGTAEYLALEKKMLVSINEMRKEWALPPVIWDAQLADCARAHSVDMRDKKYKGHERPSAPLRTISDRYAAVFGQVNSAISENIVVAFTPGVRVNAESLTNIQEQVGKSPSHRTILLDSRWTRGGIGLATDEKGGVWITQMFAHSPAKNTPR